MRRVLLAVVVVVIALIAWWLHEPEPSILGSDEVPGTTRDGTHRDGIAKPRPGKLRANAGDVRPEGTVSISGTVIDRDTNTPVGNVEVVFRNPAGEETVIAAGDGTYRIDVEPGAYRAFVRDETVLSFGPVKHTRVPTLPDADDVMWPDETAMALVVASRDLEGVDLRVLRGGIVRGFVVNRQNERVAGAIVRATGQTRPVLGTNIVETDANGEYELILPPGWHVIDAGHPAYAGVEERIHINVRAGDRSDDHDLWLVAGCVISGRVIGADGKPANEGAIEQGPDNFVVSGKIAANGTFRFTTMLTGDVTLRAWPWKSPSSPSQTFACRDGARYSVVFQVPGRVPELQGTLADADGAPVALAYLDLAPLDAGGVGQQERTDVDGKFAVFQMPAGRYRVTAYAAGRGVLSTIVTVPQTNVSLVLGGTGRIAGTAKGILDGSFDLRFTHCVDDVAVAIHEDARIASVRGGKFELDGVPACKLLVETTYEGRRVRGAVDVPVNGVGALSMVLEEERADDEPVAPRPPPRAPDPVPDEPIPDEPDAESTHEGST